MANRWELGSEDSDRLTSFVANMVADQLDWVRNQIPENFGHVIMRENLGTGRPMLETYFGEELDLPERSVPLESLFDDFPGLWAEIEPAITRALTKYYG